MFKGRSRGSFRPLRGPLGDIEIQAVQFEAAIGQIFAHSKTPFHPADRDVPSTGRP